MVAALPFFMQHGVLCILCYHILNSKCCLVYSLFQASLLMLKLYRICKIVFLLCAVLVSSSETFLLPCR